VRHVEPQRRRALFDRSSGRTTAAGARPAVMLACVIIITCPASCDEQQQPPCLGSQDCGLVCAQWAAAAAAFDAAAAAGPFPSLFLCCGSCWPFCGGGGRRLASHIPLRPHSRRCVPLSPPPPVQADSDSRANACTCNNHRQQQQEQQEARREEAIRPRREGAAARRARLQGHISYSTAYSGGGGGSRDISSRESDTTMADYATELLRRQLHGACVPWVPWDRRRTSLQQQWLAGSEASLLPPQPPTANPQTPTCPAHRLTDGRRTLPFPSPTLQPSHDAELNKNPPEGVSVGLVDDNLFEWEILLVGPADTLYEVCLVCVCLFGVWSMVVAAGSRSDRHRPWLVCGCGCDARWWWCGFRCEVGVRTGADDGSVGAHPPVVAHV
jgi:hypothetical protein